MKIVIIEDEKLTANDLAKTLLSIEPDVEIAAILASVEEATEYFDKQPDIDLIFSDIELGDGLSFAIFEKLSTTIPIVFCTAYDKYSLTAFKTAGIDYILKPFSKDSVAKTLTKYQQLKEKFSQPQGDYTFLLNQLKNQLLPKNVSVIVHQGDKIIPINALDIAIFFVESDYTFAYTFDQKKYIISQNLETLEKNFYPTFFRANRQFLINRKAVKDAAHYFNRKMIVNLTIPFTTQIIIGKLKTSAFINWLSEV
ncbi:MAG: LytR/AlgR family response regulator transcription factor [Saprospiraceae bacterium]